MENQLINDLANTVTQEAATGFFERIFDVYNSFIIIFPLEYQWVISVIIFLAIAGFMWNLIKKNWLWLVLIIVVFPGLLPVLQNIFTSLSAMFVGKPIA